MNRFCLNIDHGKSDRDWLLVQHKLQKSITDQNFEISCTPTNTDRNKIINPSMHAHSARVKYSYCSTPPRARSSFESQRIMWIICILLYLSQAHEPSIDVWLIDWFIDWLALTRSLTKPLTCCGRILEGTYTYVAVWSTIYNKQRSTRYLLLLLRYTFLTRSYSCSYRSCCNWLAAGIPIIIRSSKHGDTQR